VNAAEPSAFQCPSDEHWTEKHEAEAQLQKKRRRERALDTAAGKGLTAEELQQEIGHDPGQAVAAHKAARIEKATRYQAKKLKEARQKEKALLSILAICRGKKIFLSAGKPATGNDALDRHMTSMSAMFESSPLKAEIFVVNDIVHPPGTSLECFSEWLFSLECAGILQWERTGCEVHQYHEHSQVCLLLQRLPVGLPGLAALVVARMADPDSKWKLLSDSHQFFAVLTQAEAKQRAASELLAFVTETDR
jgi:cell division protein FtsL